MNVKRGISSKCALRKIFRPPLRRLMCSVSLLNCHSWVFQTSGWRTFIRMAYIDRFTEQKELNEFGQEVAENRGVDVRIFASMEEADKWLQPI